MLAWGYWNISLRSLAGSYDDVIIIFSLFWWDSSTGSRRCKGVDTHCLSRCRILWADAKCWTGHLFPPLMLFLHGEQEQPASVWSHEPVLSTLSHFCPLCWECPFPLPGSLLWTSLLSILPFLPLCGFCCHPTPFIHHWNSSFSASRGLWRSLSAVNSGSFPTNC